MTATGVSSASPVVTGAQTETVRDYSGSASETFASAVEIAWLRDRSQLVINDVTELHRDFHSSALEERAAIKARKSVTSLLDELGEQHGMGWSDIADLVMVSVSAIRKWRKGGDATPDSRYRLARLAAFLELLSEISVEDPAQWMEIPLPTQPGYSVRPIDLYKAGNAVVVLDIASRRIDVEEGLNEADPDWRSRWRTSFEVFDASDGQKAIRVRDDC